VEPSGAGVCVLGTVDAYAERCFSCRSFDTISPFVTPDALYMLPQLDPTNEVFFNTLSSLSCK
jgi:hypothetical protein